MTPTQFLRVEGLAVVGGAVGVYFGLDGPLWLLVVLAVAPDLSMLGYLAGPRIGSYTYNVVHTYVLPLTLGGLGVWFGTTIAILVAAVWTAHIGFDRMLGYGLKFETGFRDTHLSVSQKPTQGTR